MHLGIAELGHAEELAHVGRGDLFLVLCTLLHYAAGYLAAYVADFALQVAHAGFARVAANDLANCVVLEDDVLFAEASALALLLHEVLPCDLQLFLLCIALQPQNFHAVLQCSGNGVHHVCRGDEQHLREVVVHVEVVILERGVLLGVQHFQQCRSWIAAEVRGHFVDLIEQKDGVLGACALHVLDDLARQRSNVGAAMTADLGLIAHAAQGQAHELAARGLRNRHAQRRFAYARRPDEAEDRALRIFDQLAHGEELEDALLDLLKAVVIFVQHFLGEVDGARFLGTLLPRHGEQPVDVVAAHGGLGRHGWHGFELLQLLDRLVEHILGHACGLDLLAQFVELALFAAPQFLLDGLDLFVEVVLFLRPLHLPLYARLDVAVKVEFFDFDVEHIGNARQARRGIEDAEQFLLLLDADLQICRDGVRELGCLVHAHGGDDGLVVERLLQLYVLLKERGDALHQLLGGRCHFKIGLAGAHRGHEEAVAVVHFDGLGALHALDQHLDVAIGHLDALHNVADGADLVDFLGLGFVDRGVVLRGEKDLAVAVERFFQRTHAGLPAHHEGRHHVGEDHHVPDGHHGQLAGFGLFARRRHGHTLSNRRRKRAQGAEQVA